MQSSEGIWNATISALKAADVRSKEQLDAMFSEDLKRVPMPITVCSYLLKIRKEVGRGRAGRSQAGSDVSGGLDATADHYEWMHTCLARLLPESMQSNEGIWNGTISALKAADVRSEEQLDAMSKEDLKKANVPLLVRALLLKIRKSGEILSPQAILLTKGAEGGEGKAETPVQTVHIDLDLTASNAEQQLERQFAAAKATNEAVIETDTKSKADTDKNKSADEKKGADEDDEAGAPPPPVHLPPGASLSKQLQVNTSNEKLAATSHVTKGGDCAASGAASGAAGGKLPAGFI
jgi:hypothetical protein